MLEGTEEITLTFTSAIPDFVRRVEDIGDFASLTAVVKIIDSEGKLWSKRELHSVMCISMSMSTFNVSQSLVEWNERNTYALENSLCTYGKIHQILLHGLKGQENRKFRLLK